MIQKRFAHDVLQFASISRKVQQAERRYKIEADLPQRPGLQAVMLARKVLDQQRQVAGPLAQWRDLDQQYTQSMEQIESKLALGNHALQVAICGCDKAHIHGRLDLFAHRQHAVLPQHAQKLGLESRLQLANFVEEQHASLGGSDQSYPIPLRSRERAAPVAKKVTFRKPGIDGGAIDRDKRPLAALWVHAVNRARQQLLASAAFPSDEDRQVAHAAESHCPVEGHQHRGAIAYHTLLPHDQLSSLLRDPQVTWRMKSAFQQQTQ